jgi:hypothetical protein
VSQAIQSFQEYHRLNSKKNTLKNYEFIFTQFQEAYGDRQIDTITSDDVLSFLTSRIEPDLLNRVVLIALLGPKNDANFEFHLTDWLGGKSVNSLPVFPEIAKVADKRFLYIHSEKKKGRLCPQLSGNQTRVGFSEGAHHF